MGAWAHAYFILPYQVWPSDYQSDLDNRCVWSGYENEGCEQHEYSLWRHRLTDCSVEVTLRSDCLGRLNQLWIGQGGGGRRGGSELIAHIQVIQVLPVADNCIDEDGLFGQRQQLVHCRHHLSTFSRLCVDISCKLYSQQLVKRRRARRCHDWQLRSGEGCCCRLTGCVVTQLSDYDGVYTLSRCLYERNIPNTTRWHTLTTRWHDGVMLGQHYKPWTSITLWLSQRLVLAGRHLLFVNNEYAYLFIRAHQPLRYQREEDN